MVFLTKILITIYGALMAVASLVSYKQLPLWLVCLNITADALLILACIFSIVGPVSGLLVIILLIALANGYFLHRKITWSHWLIRLFFTATLIWLNLRYL